MSRLTQHPRSLAGRIRILAWTFVLVLSWASLAGAIDLVGSSTISLSNPNDPNT